MSVVFSIIVPVYNTEDFVTECVESIIAQDFWSYEIILVDDGSKDRSSEICDALAMQYPEQISVIHQENAGQFCARKKGIKQAQGDYLVFVDADDLLEPYALSCLYRIYTEQHVDMVVYTLSSVNSSGVALKSSMPVFSRGLISKDVFLRQMIKTGKLSSIVLKSFVRKEYAFDCGHRISYGEDFLMSLMVLDAIQTVWYEPTALYRYRYNASSMTNRQNVFAYRDYLYVADYTIQYIAEQNLGDDLTEEYLRHFVATISVALSQICLGKTADTKVPLADLYGHVIVRRCKSFVCSARLRDQIPLRLFYRERYRMLILYERIYYKLHEWAVAAKRRMVRRSLSTNEK